MYNRRPENIFNKIQIPNRSCKVTTLNLGQNAQHSYFNIGLRVFCKMPSVIKNLKGHKLKSAIKSEFKTPNRARAMLRECRP